MEVTIAEAEYMTWRKRSSQVKRRKFDDEPGGNDRAPGVSRIAIAAAVIPVATIPHRARTASFHMIAQMSGSRSRQGVTPAPLEGRGTPREGVSGGRLSSSQSSASPERHSHGRSAPPGYVRPRPGTRA